MKKVFVLFLVALFILCEGCSSSKTSSDDALYQGIWELEYISGPKIAFEGLFPDQKPQLTFVKDENSVHGTTGCNGYSAGVEIKGTTIKFGKPGAMTMRYCEGGGEQVFLQTLENITVFGFDDNHKLLLKMDEVPMLRFKKVK